MENKITYEYISEYIKNTVKREEPFLEELEEAAKNEHIPILKRDAARFLGFLTALTGAKNILEIGTAIGYSAMLMYNASGKTAHITTLERDEEMFLSARRNIKNLGLSGAIKPVFGDAAEELDYIDGVFDLIFIDAAKGQTGILFDKCLSKIKTGGLIVTDNVLYGGMTASDALAVHKHKTITQNMRAFIQMVCSDERFDTSIVPIGDGMALTIVKGQM